MRKTSQRTGRPFFDWPVKDYTEKAQKDIAKILKDHYRSHLKKLHYMVSPIFIINTIITT